MQMAITFMAVVAGMIFSLAVALLAEELIFGQVFRLFFSQQNSGRETGTETLTRERTDVSHSRGLERNSYGDIVRACGVQTVQSERRFDADRGL